MGLPFYDNEGRKCFKTTELKALLRLLSLSQSQIYISEFREQKPIQAVEANGTEEIKNHIFWKLGLRLIDPNNFHPFSAYLNEGKDCPHVD